MIGTTIRLVDEQDRDRVASYRTGTWIGALLRTRREELGLSQRDVERMVDANTTALGERPSIGAAGLSRLEAGYRYPTLRTLEALAGPLQLRFHIGPETTSVERIDDAPETEAPQHQ